MEEKIVEEIMRILKAIEPVGKPFSLKPSHWWSYLNPFWWKRKRVCEKVLGYQWENGGKEDFEKRVRNTLLYGTSHPETWKNKND